jgi:aminopeptidase N
MAKPKTVAAPEPTPHPVLRVNDDIESNLSTASVAELALFALGAAGDQDAVSLIVGELHNEAGTMARLLEAGRETLWLSSAWFAMERKLALVGELLARERGPRG